MKKTRLCSGLPDASCRHLEEEALSVTGKNTVVNLAAEGGNKGRGLPYSFSIKHLERLRAWEEKLAWLKQGKTQEELRPFSVGQAQQGVLAVCAASQPA